MKDEGEKIFCALCATFGSVQVLQPPQYHTASSVTVGSDLSYHINSRIYYHTLQYIVHYNLIKLSNR